MSRFPTLRAAPFTLLMALSLVLIYATTWVMGGDEAIGRLFSAGTFVTVRVETGEWWRFLTSDVVHSSWDHVLWNCAGLLLVGLNLEPKLGTRRTAILYVLGALCSSTATFVFCTRGGGASGAIFALIGTYLTRPMRIDKQGLPAVGIGWLLAAYWTYRVLSNGRDVYEIGNEAHVAGLVLGLTLGAFWDYRGLPATSTQTRARRVALVTSATLTLIVALAPESRWWLGWCRNSAIQAEHVGDRNGAARQWKAIEEAADPTEPVDAVFVENAARFRLRQHDYVGARALLSSVAPTLRNPAVYRDVGVLMAQYEPCDEVAAFKTWNQALELNPCLPEVLDLMATTLLRGDSTASSARGARALAWCAVSDDGMKTAEYLHTLAWADRDCGHPDRAVSWMQRAIALNPPQRADLVSELGQWVRCDRARWRGAEAQPLAR